MVFFFCFQVVSTSFFNHLNRYSRPHSVRICNQHAKSLKEKVQKTFFSLGIKCFPISLRHASTRTYIKPNFKYFGWKVNMQVFFLFIVARSAVTRGYLFIVYARQEFQERSCKAHFISIEKWKRWHATCFVHVPNVSVRIAWNLWHDCFLTITSVESAIT